MAYNSKKYKSFFYFLKSRYYFNKMIKDINTNLNKPKTASTKVFAEFGEKRF